MRFSLKKIEVLLFAAFFGLFCVLGIWQLQRAAEKRDIAETINARSEAAALDLTGPVERAANELEYQQVRVRGEFVPRGQLLIDNIMSASQPGYHVITPFKISGSDWSILVNRGWVAQGVSRQQYPEVDVPGGEISLQGIIRSPSPLPFVDSTAVPLDESENFNLWLYLDLDRYRQESSLQLLPFAMLQYSNTGDSLLRKWPPYKAKTAMHLGYALQWFGLALVVCLMFYGLARKRANKEEV